MKKISITVIVLFSQIVYSQSAGVGINTTTPKSTFDINGKKDTSGIAVSTDIAGLQAPRLTRAELTNKGDALYGPDQKGAMVYITDVSGGNVTGQRSNITSVGYYYFDGSAWQKMVTTTLQPWHSTTTGTGEATVTENIYHSGNVGIGTAQPIGALDVSGTNGAITIPRMTTTQRDNLDNTKRTAGSIIYNTTSNQFQVYNGTNWLSLVSTNSIVSAPTSQLILLAKGGEPGIQTNIDGPFAAEFKMATFPIVEVNYDTPGTGYNSSTSIYTAPISGVYQINTSLFMNGCTNVNTGSFNTVRIAKSGQGIGLAETKTTVLNSGGIVQNLFATVKLNAGDKVGIDYNNAASTAYCLNNYGGAHFLAIYRFQ
ncbi:hypothetical protein ABE425_15605 [Chryseobacterium cucumeris]|uniref:hypothetical protein n=1 Tax=Chryseobacterium TaxID=59732 RepID=UPI002882E053|nr:hypothetical protein [Chryseobacterium sp. SG20098]WNI36453.1 hypothetical protein RHP76_21295 [Chryseobacterium sp. SG20098]